MGPTGPAGSANINGTTNYIIKFTSATTGGNSLLFDNGTAVGLGTTTPGFPMQVLGTNASRNVDVVNSNAAGDGVWGSNTAAAGAGGGAGVVGFSAQSSALAAGVWGANTNTTGTGVTGIGNNQASTVLVAGSGGAFTGFTTGVFAKSTTAGTGEAIYTDQFGDIVRVGYWNGGTFFKINGVGSVSTIVRDPTDEAGQRWVTMHAPETPEILFEDYGQAQLEDGVAHVDIDPIFAANVLIDERHPLRVFIQVEENEWTRGVIVKNKTPTGFDVVELDGGTSSLPFQWHIVANRADEILPSGRLSRNADMRFEVVTDILPTLTGPSRTSLISGASTTPEGGLPASTTPATSPARLFLTPSASGGDSSSTWMTPFLPLTRP